MVARGVRGQAIPASQAQRLLARQLRQVPRWLQQTRYNGPPPLKTPRGSIATASNYSNNAALAGDGVHLAYESYDAKLATAKARGEIGVAAGALGALAKLGSAAAAHAALGLQPGGLGRRALRRLRVGRGQPQLRQALRADARLRDRHRDGPDAARLARDRLQARPPLRVQPVALGGRAHGRVRDLGVLARRARRLGRGPAALAGGARSCRRTAWATSTSRRCPADGRSLAFTAVVGRLRA